MVKRQIKEKLSFALEAVSFVALLEPRQVGKTTLAIEVSKQVKKMQSIQI